MIKVVKKLFSILTKKQKKTTVLLCILMLIGGVMETVSVSLIMPLLNAVMDAQSWREPFYAKFLIRLFNINEQKTYIIVLLTLLIVMFIVKNLYLFMELYIQNTFIGRSRRNLQNSLLRCYLKKPYEFFLSTSTSDITRTLGSDTHQCFAALTNTLTFATEMIVAIFLAVTVFIISPIIAIVLIGILSLEIFVIGRFVKPVMRRLGTRQRKESSLSHKWLLQAIQGIKSIKVAGTEGFFADEYEKHTNLDMDIQRKSQTLNSAPKLIIESFTIAVVLLMMLVMVACGNDLKLIVPQLSAFLVAAVRLLPGVNRISTAVNGIPYSEPSIDNVIKVLTNESIIGRKESILKDDKVEEVVDRIAFREGITFDHITYKYPGTEKLIFDDVSFDIKCGESVGIVGTSGAGKTTAVDIMLGLLEPTNGRVLVDGVDIKDNIKGFLSTLSYVPQMNFLLDDTIAANVAFGIDKEKIDYDRVKESLKEAKLMDFVDELPDGVETYIGERGIRISGGQRQRIGIARALYTNPSIIVFDEATSALDNETEKSIMQSIDSLKGKKTLIIIAHRLTTIENCDTVYKVEKGCVKKRQM